jgi:hypothetical protein
MSSQSEVIETTVSKVAAELTSHGLDPDDRVTITIEPDELIPGRRASRARVIAAGLTDDDIDRLIKRNSMPGRAVHQASPFCGGLRHGIDRGDAFPSSTIYDGAFTSSAEADAPRVNKWVGRR